MSTKFFTNENENTLINKIEGIFKHRSIHFFDALVGYFRASGYFRIRKFIEKAAEIRILVGINVDNLIYDANQRGLLFDQDPDKSQENFFNDIKKNIQEAEYDKDVEEGMLELIKDITSKRIKIKVHPRQNIHAKIYIFREKLKHDHGYGAVITGSSNLTDAGLSKNFEFNVELRDNTDIDFATETFNKLWEESIEINESYIDKLKKETFLNDEFSPFEVYMKFLIEYFGRSIEFDPNSITDLPQGFKKLSYQADAVSDGYQKMMKHNGFFLADVVGLGKTIVSILIAKKFFYSNGFPTYRSRTLIICPPTLKDNWEETASKFHLDNYRIVTNGSLHKVTKPEDFDLVIVDEAHKFRTDTAEMYNLLQKICKTDARKVLQNGEHDKKKVILVSATPLNNRPEDIANQVYLFQDSKNSTIEGNLQHFFRQQIDAYKRLKQDTDIKRVRLGVKVIYDRIRIKVIEPLTVRRTRTDLTEHELYSKDLITQGVIFPHVNKPEKIFYQLDDQLDNLYDKTIQYLSHPTKGLTYNRYRAIQFLKPHKKSKYKAPDLISTQLAKIMKTLLVKRIDSSFFAFKQSLKRFSEATNAMVKMFNNGAIYIAPNLSVSEYINDDREEELIKLVSEQSPTDPTIEVCTPDDFEPGFLTGLLKDKEILDELVEDWKHVEQDPKLDVFVKYIQEKLFAKKDNPEQKLVVFSESKETTEYLQSKLKDLTDKKFLTVSSSSRKELMPAIKANFDANIPLAEQRNEYDIIISTEVLAEGINLHRANIIVNYDTPWNSTKLMQRIGRVNRIGSRADVSIHIFNFFPTAKVNSDIELEKKAVMKLEAFHSALGEDSQIYSPDEEPGTFGLFDKNIEEGKDEKLVILMMLRKFKLDSPELFKMIKNMPLRSRVGRKSKTLKNSTITFIRNERRDAFYFIREDGTIDELSFLEAVKEFQAKADEKSILLHKLHHEQVKEAVNFFADKLEKEKAREGKVDVTQGPNEKKALSYLDAFMNLPFTNNQEKQTIIRAKHAIRIGKFQNLQRDINKLQKAVKKIQIKPVHLLEKVMHILNDYPLNTIEEEETVPQPVIPKFTNLNPEIIISESFSL